MHFLITGHTGFKGAWLTLLLMQRGHTVSGIALDPLLGALFERAELSQDLKYDIRLDIRDARRVHEAFELVRPDVVVHMAAQPLVRESYRNPRYTFETNVNGTLNVLEATRSTPGIQAQLIVTTDKVYRNIGKSEGYIETDPLGGHDPYSASKAMADLLTQSWVESFIGVPTAIARAGNVIGGGDVSPDRLLPDVVAAFSENRPAVLRHPEAVRPWQHVLDCLSGYLVLIEALLDGGGTGAWNFGPAAVDIVRVADVVSKAASCWGMTSVSYDVESSSEPEAKLLTLSAEKALRELHWAGALTWQEAVEWTIDWQKGLLLGTSARQLCIGQIDMLEALQVSRTQ